MSHQKSLFIVIEYFNDQNNYEFGSSVSDMIEAQKQKEDTLMVIDNHSDGITTHYALQVMNEYDRIIAINYFKEEVSSLGKASPILNAIIKKDTGVYTNSENRLIKPIMRLKKGKVFANPQELHKMLF